MGPTVRESRYFGVEAGIQVRRHLLSRIAFVQPLQQRLQLNPFAAAQGQRLQGLHAAPVQMLGPQVVQHQPAQMGCAGGRHIGGLGALARGFKFDADQAFKRTALECVDRYRRPTPAVHVLNLRTQRLHAGRIRVVIVQMLGVAEGERIGQAEQAQRGPPQHQRGVLLKVGPEVAAQGVDGARQPEVPLRQRVHQRRFFTQPDFAHLRALRFAAMFIGEMRGQMRGQLRVDAVEV